MSQVQTQDSERRCLLPVLWLPCGGRKKEEEKKEKNDKDDDKDEGKDENEDKDTDTPEGSEA